MWPISTGKMPSYHTVSFSYIWLLGMCFWRSNWFIVVFKVFYAFSFSCLRVVFHICQSDDGTVPLFSIPRTLIAENPFTSLLLCSCLPSTITTSQRSSILWCQHLAIEVIAFCLCLMCVFTVIASFFHIWLGNYVWRKSCL